MFVCEYASWINKIWEKSKFFLVKFRLNNVLTVIHTESLPPPRLLFGVFRQASLSFSKEWIARLWPDGIWKWGSDVRDVGTGLFLVEAKLGGKHRSCYKWITVSTLFKRNFTRKNLLYNHFDNFLPFYHFIYPVALHIVILWNLFFHPPPNM